MRQKDRQLVSVIIPSFNREKIITNTLESVQAQTHKSWECIIVDDGSTDGTEEVVTAFAKADSRFSFYKRPSSKLKGANACRNFGFEQSKGAYINWLDSDDVLHPEKLEKQVQALRGSQHPFTICQTDIWNVTLHKNMGLRSEAVISSTPLDDYITFAIFWGIQAPLWKRETIESYRFNEKLQQSQEYDYHIRILAEHSRYHTTDEVLTTIISHSDNMSVSRVDRMDKFMSNLQVRYMTLKNLNDSLLPETKSYLFSYFYTFYKTMVRDGAFKKAYVCLKYMRKSISLLDDYKGQKNKYLLRWSLAIPSFFLFKKGESFLKNIT